MVKLGYTILYVTNVAKSSTFYTSAFGFPLKFITPEGDYAELNTGETTLAFVSLELANLNLNNQYKPSTLIDKPFGIELALTTENVQNVMDLAISHGAILHAPLTQKPWGQTVGYIRDLDGFLLEICTPIN